MRLDGASEVTVSTELLHNNGQELKLEISWYVTDNKIHTLGSTITYLKRYGITAILGIVTEEDDDGHRAQDQEQPRGEPRKLAQKPPASAPAPAKAPVAARKPLPTDAEQIAAGLIANSQVKALQGLRNNFNVPDDKWKLWLTTKYGISTAYKIKITDYPAIEGVLTLNAAEIIGFTASDDAVE
jgi:hypothetical protein